MQNKADRTEWPIGAKPHGGSPPATRVILVVIPGWYMGTKTKQLIAILDQLIAILDADGESHWRKWMASSRSRLLNSDYSGIDHLLGAYGGMGSFNDLVIGQSMVNGQFRWKDGAREANDTLDSLRTEAYQVADFIKRNHDIETA